MKAPYTYDTLNLIKGLHNPSSVHTRNTGLFNFYVKYFLQKLISVFEFKNIPESWALNYFQYVLLGYGFIAIFNDNKMGVICQQCTLSDTYTLYYQPKKVLISNPVLNLKELEIGKDCELIKLQPNFSSPLDIITTYADLMAISLETASVNLMNSKASFIFFAKNQQMANTFKAVYDDLASGKPFAIVDKEFGKDEEGGLNWEFFTQNVGQNYITDRILNDMKTIEDRFNTHIGIPNANTQKRERLISSEVMANDIDTTSLVTIWLDTMREGIDKVNRKYNLNIEVDYRYKLFYNEDGEVLTSQQEVKK